MTLPCVDCSRMLVNPVLPGPIWLSTDRLLTLVSVIVPPERVLIELVP